MEEGERLKSCMTRSPSRHTYGGLEKILSKKLEYKDLWKSSGSLLIGCKFKNTNKFSIVMSGDF